MVKTSTLSEGTTMGADTCDRGRDLGPAAITDVQKAYNGVLFHSINRDPSIAWFDTVRKLMSRLHLWTIGMNLG